MADSPIGITLALTTSSITLNVVSMTPPSQPINVLDTTTLGTTEYKTSIPGKLRDPGQLEAVVLLDPDDLITMNAASTGDVGETDTLTVTWPVPAGGATGATTVGSGYVVDFSPQEMAAEEDSPMLANFVWQWDGLTGPTETAST